MGLLKFIFSPILFVLDLLKPKSKEPKPDAATDLEDPTAEAGRPIPVVFGTMTVKGLNVVWFGNKQIHSYKKKVD